MITQFEGQRAYEHIHQLAVKIGPRLCGTASEDKAVEYARTIP